MLATLIYIMEVFNMFDNSLPWERPRIKRILDIFGGGTRVYTVKNISTIREVNYERIQR